MIIALVNVAPVAAQAVPATPENPCPVTEAGAYVCQPKSSVTAAGYAASNSTSSRAADSGPQTVYVPYKRISADANGNACIETRYIPQGTPARPNFGLADTEQTPGAVSGLYDTAPPCPQATSQSRSPGTTPILIALEHWSRVPLPRPEPRIAPGRAITGKLAYLETRGSLTYTYAASTVFGLLQITATGAYWIEWGDGATGGPFGREGRPWPEGHITQIGRAHV